MVNKKISHLKLLIAKRDRAVKRVNKILYKKIKELLKDKDFREKIDQEIEDLKTAEDLRSYAEKDAQRISEDEVKSNKNG